MHLKNGKVVFHHMEVTMYCTFVLSGYDIHHCVDAYISCPRKPRFSIQVPCHEEDLLNWLLDMDFKKEDSHGLALERHPRFKLSENCLVARWPVIGRDGCFFFS